VILILKHAAIEGAGSIGDYFDGKYYEVKTLEMWKGDILPGSIDHIEAVICMGGPMNVYQESEFPFLKHEDAFIREIVKRGVPFLGVCLGAQLLAKACGSLVYRAPVGEMGWSEVRLTPAGSADPMFKNLPQVLSVFQWHEDTFDIPDAGTLLATSRSCANQAFCIGKRAYGFQFHVEVSPDIVSSWVAALAAENKGAVADPAVMFDAYELRPYYEAQAAVLCGNFLNIVEVWKHSSRP